MAYHDSNGGYFFDGEYPSTHYHNYPHHYQYDYVPVVQDPAFYYDNNVEEHPPFSSSNSAAYCHAYATTASQPLFLAYEPDESFTHYSEFQQTRPIVSYSVSDFNETDYEEYDPTPYGGGYDLVQTYGKPLPYSDDTCYPRSTAGPIPAAAPAIAKQPQIGNEKQPTSPKVPAVEEEKHTIPEAEDGGIGGGYGFDGGEAGRVVPAGYGLETVDLCESLFGNWPCLEKFRRENDYGKMGGGDCGFSDGGEWNEMAADYLFGSSYDPYDGERRKDPWGYQWRAENDEQALTLYPPADKYVEDSW
ncbi:unnamed protein product [Linum trigynum]|uniref:Uncharacterized protein n=1 Tax=Linum trigynum TaxID=586398 RepID=A0AAV2FHA7_9ROSI